MGSCPIDGKECDCIMPCSPPEAGHHYIATPEPCSVVFGDIKLANKFIISCGAGNVSICTDTGKVTFNNCTPDDAARRFWEVVERMFPRRANATGERG